MSSSSSNSSSCDIERNGAVNILCLSHGNGYRAKELIASASVLGISKRKNIYNREVFLSNCLKGLLCDFCCGSSSYIS